ncbi:MAG: hypothetical protein LBT26_11325 [Clostridiales Family XIII bacterium]|nr:hypothetical protein [Clostridiales Family XIII bacterium]
MKNAEVEMNGKENTEMLAIGIIAAVIWALTRKPKPKRTPGYVETVVGITVLDHVLRKVWK